MKIEKELEDDIINQVNNYNEESKKIFSNWIELNNDNIKKWIQRIFGFLNLISKPIIKYDIRPNQLISLLFLNKNNKSCPI